LVELVGLLLSDFRQPIEVCEWFRFSLLDCLQGHNRKLNGVLGSISSFDATQLFFHSTPYLRVRPVGNDSAHAKLLKDSDGRGGLPLEDVASMKERSRSGK